MITVTPPNSIGICPICENEGTLGEGCTVCHEGEYESVAIDDCNICGNEGPTGEGCSICQVGRFGGEYDVITDDEEDFDAEAAHDGEHLSSDNADADPEVTTQIINTRKACEAHCRPKIRCPAMDESAFRYKGRKDPSYGRQVRFIGGKFRGQVGVYGEATPRMHRIWVESNGRWHWTFALSKVFMFD